MFVFRPREFLYPSNMLTVSRIVLIPPAVISLYRSDKRQHAFLCIGVAMATDAFDGIVARQRGEISELGKFLDPIADKLLLNAIAVTLSLKREIPWWLTGLFVARDVGILLASLVVLRRKQLVLPSLLSGRATVALLTAGMLAYVARWPTLGQAMLYGSLASGVASVVEYSWRFARIMPEPQTNQPTDE